MNFGSISSAIKGAVSATFGHSDTSHYGASRSARELSTWNPRSGSADTDLLPEVEMLRNRARDVDRNSGLAAGARITSNDNVIGTGLNLAPKPNYGVLGETSEWASDWANKVKPFWRDFSESKNFDHQGRMNFAQMSKLVYDTAYTTGSAVVIPYWEKRYGTKYRTCFKIVESDRLCNPNDLADTARIRGGVEYDQKGRVVAYHIRSHHPGDDIQETVMATWERIPARTRWGRSRLIHVYRQDRPGQSRGKAKASAVLAALGMRSKYQLTELQAAIVNSKIAGILESDMTCEEASEVFGMDRDELKAMQFEWGGQLSAGAILNTPIGTKFQSHIPNRPASGYANYMEAIAREIGAGIGLPYELLARDFSKTNYSSARAALIEAWRHFRVERAEIAFQWADEVYCLFMEEAVSLGLIKAKEFYGNIGAYCRAMWLGVGFQPVDELKHARSISENLANGSLTKERMYAESGLDWQEEEEQRYREAKYENEMASKYTGGKLLKGVLADDAEPEETEEAPAVQAA